MMPTLGLDRASLSNLLSTLTERGRSLLGLSNGARPMSQADYGSNWRDTLVTARRSHRRRIGKHAACRIFRSGGSRSARLPQCAGRVVRSRHGRSERRTGDRARQRHIARCHRQAPEGRRTRRQELIRRLNLAPGGTAALVKMREALLAHIKDHPPLKHVDNDFVHLFASWFNRGFLVLQRIDWTTPANITGKDHPLRAGARDHQLG